MTPLIRKRDKHRGKPELNKQRPIGQPPAVPEGTVSIIGPGMTLVGDCKSEGTIRIEGRVEGNVESGKSIMIAKDAVVTGDIIAHDAIISGRIQGRLTVASMVGLQASCSVNGEINARHMLIEEGAVVNASVKMTSQPSPSTS